MDIKAPLPRPSNPDQAKAGFERWFEAASQAARETSGEAPIEALLEKPDIKPLLDGIFGNSPFLTRSAIREADFMVDLLQGDPTTLFDAEIADLTSSAQGADGRSLTQLLRRAKRRGALIVAFADISGMWDVDAVTTAMTRLADTSLQIAVRHVFMELQKQGKIDAETPGQGYVLLGMGKHGAGELNYSSDVDIIALYEPEKVGATNPDTLRQDMVRATQAIVQLMEQRTGDGYVFRTDLRLRPDPGLTPIAITVEAAEQYYESVGQNWERAAMIKARPVAGDVEVGYGFLRHIRPFVWRKHLDFAAVADVHSIKRQINAHRGGSEIAVEGHNIKLGRGGIREIEFYAQTQQLIWGGRQPQLRTRRTLDTLAALQSSGHIEADTATALSECYFYLRRLEHRLQMINDEQTQKMPVTAEAVDGVALFMGHADPADFRAGLLQTLRTVEKHYAKLFEDEPDLSAGGTLVFTGAEDDPETRDTLAEMGFEDPAHIANRVRVWHHGRYRATRSERSRQILTELMPAILEALSKTTNPDQAFARFDSFLTELPAGVQIFSLFHSNPALLTLVAEIMGDAPRLADWLTRRPILLDGVIGDAPGTTHEAPDRFSDTLKEALSEATDFQDVLDVVRRWANDRKFQIGLDILHGDLDGESAGPVLSRVAETALSGLVPAVEHEFAHAHGLFHETADDADPDDVEDAGFGVIAFGKLGGQELAPMSDLDLVFIYAIPDGVDASNGTKPLAPMVYYTRFCQRLMTAITTQTPEGTLYEADTRLRPNGRAGPLGTRFEGFESYYLKDAWTWEHMALTRARPVYGTPALCSRIERVIEQTLRQERDIGQLATDIDDMRRRIAKQYPGTERFSIKYRPGGLLDIEFIAQHLQLAHATSGKDILATNTETALRKLAAADFLDIGVSQELLEALTLWRNLQAVIRLTAADGFDAEAAPDGQKQLLARTANLPSFAALEETVDTTALTVRGHYDSLILGPADDHRQLSEKSTKDPTGTAREIEGGADLGETDFNRPEIPD